MYPVFTSEEQSPGRAAFIEYLAMEMSQRRRYMRKEKEGGSGSDTVSEGGSAGSGGSVESSVCGEFELYDNDMCHEAMCGHGFYHAASVVAHRCPFKSAGVWRECV